MGKISWLPPNGKTWNPVTGCTKISPACDNCYAMAFARRLKAMGQIKYAEWPAVRCHGDVLDEPLKWKKPRTIFVNSMSDTFHEEVPVEFIDKIFATMARCQQHTFILCIKRAERMWRKMAHMGAPLCINKEAGGTIYDDPLRFTWPLPNVIGMVTAENQAQWDTRVPWLLKTPFVRRWVSIEPMLEYIYTRKKILEQLDGVIVGGESGPKARPIYPDWVRTIRDDCAAAGIGFHFKQWGDSVQVWPKRGEYARLNMYANCHAYNYKTGLDNGSRFLDGRTHDDMPTIDREVKS